MSSVAPWCCCSWAIPRLAARALAIDPSAGSGKPEAQDHSRPANFGQLRSLAGFRRKLVRNGVLVQTLSAANTSCELQQGAGYIRLRRSIGACGMPGLHDLSGSAHWRNKCDAGLVVYRDFDQGETLVLTRKIRKQPICGVQGAVTFVFNPVARRYDDVEGSFRIRGRRR